MHSIPFVKYSGNGNDFIILDHPFGPITESIVKRLCDRHFGVGADGVLVLSDAVGVDGRMQIFNSDGGEAEMCGNGLRCLVTYLDKITKIKKDTYQIKTMNAVYAVKRKNETFALEMSEISERNLFGLDEFHEFEKKFYINTGVPHLVFLSRDVKKIEIKKTGSFYRFHPIFPKGTNVNFVQVDNEENHRAYVRTYERGVEDETFSCGTGLTATALALQSWFGWNQEIHLMTKGGLQVVELNEKVYYSGEVKFCFKGEAIL